MNRSIAVQVSEEHDQVEKVVFEGQCCLVMLVVGTAKGVLDLLLIIF